MIPQPAQHVPYDATIQITDPTLVEKLGESVLVGKWFVFLSADWLGRSGMERMLALAGLTGAAPKATILFRGDEELALPGATITPTPLPTAQLVSLTSDKALYRAHHDTVRLLIAAPQHTQPEKRKQDQPQSDTTLKLRLRLGSATYGEYPVTLDGYGLALWSLAGLPEGAYEATLEGMEEETTCHFEVAEYRLAPLHAELVDQQLKGDTLRYTLAVSAFGQPYSGPIEMIVQERGQNVGKRERLSCNREGLCRSVVALKGGGPFSLNLFVGERSATVALKGSEEQRRESLIISELGEIRAISLMPLPQANMCRGIFVTRSGSNDAPLVMQRAIGSEAEITPRVAIDQLKVVVVNPANGATSIHEWATLPAGESIRLSIPAPYGVLLLGAFIDGKAWEGWCTVLRPPALQVRCEVPHEAKPGERVRVTLWTNRSERVVPVQLIVKDQRLVTPSDPQVELAAGIKRNLAAWREQSATGNVERQLAEYRLYPHFRPHPFMMRAIAMPVASPPLAPPLAMPQFMATASRPVGAMEAAPPVPVPAPAHVEQQQAREATLASLRVQFPEVIYNAIVYVQGETTVEVKLGDGLTRYSIEAFALSAETLDWQRVEASVQAIQPVYGELTVSPFVAQGDTVLGRLDVGAASGGAMVEVRHDNEILPLFHSDGSEVLPGLPVPSGSTLHFPLRPGVITSIVRDARKGGIDASERYVTEPGKLRHIARRVRLLTPGEQVRLEQPPMLELKPMPGLERPFQFFLEGAVYYPFGCIEQTSMKILAMFTGYIVNRENAEIATTYAAAIPAWYKRLRSMVLPRGGFCMYPPEEGGSTALDTHYAPRGVQHLLHLPSPERAGIRDKALQEILQDISALASKAAAYYKLSIPPKQIQTCHDAYAVMQWSASQEQRTTALAFARAQLRERDGQVCVTLPAGDQVHHLYGAAVAQRQETAYAAATLLAGRQASDIPRAIAATNYLTSQLNEAGRLYSTVDTAACLSLLLGLREAGIVTTASDEGGGLIEVNGQAMTLAAALTFGEKVETLRCIEGVLAVQVTSEVVEDWSILRGTIKVQVSLEQDGKARQSFRAGDDLELVIRVPRYEPGLIAHVCLPDALARIAGGGQIKRFSLDFCEKNTLRIPLAAISSTSVSDMKSEAAKQALQGWFGKPGQKGQQERQAANAQHWAVIVRSMYDEEQVGNPGWLAVQVE